MPAGENPSMPIRSGSMPHSSALLRTRLQWLRWASKAARRATAFGLPGRRGARYLRTIPVTPIELSQLATSSPSRS